MNCRLARGAFTLLALSTGAVSAQEPGQQAQHTITKEFISRMVALGDTRISPDGKSVLFIVARGNEEKNRYETELYLVDVASGQRRALTFERPDVAFPRWSPSGDRIAFLANDKDSQTQLWIMSLRGGDARRITKPSTGVQQYAWSPDGKWIAFVTPDELPNKAEREKGHDAFEIGDDHFLTNAPTAPSHIWIVPAEGGEAKRLTSGSWTLQNTLPPSSPPSPISWSPDGKEILFVRQDKVSPGDSDVTYVQAVDVATGKIRSLTGNTLFESTPAFSPDGLRAAYWYTPDTKSLQTDIYLCPAAGGAGKNVCPGIDRDLCLSDWMPDGKSILVGANDGTGVSLWIQPLDGAARKLDLGDIAPTWDFSIDATVSGTGAIAFTGAAKDHPTELYYLASPDAKPRRLTDFNDEVKAIRLGNSEPVEWKSDRFQVDGVLTYPPGFDSKKRYPLVVNIHGGPQAASSIGFSATTQWFAAQGWIVFEPNYRGSDNLGNAFMAGIYNDAGAGPGRDVMAGIEAIKSRAFVDRDRVAVAGWSYGGYMSVWMTGHYTGWKCSVAGAAMTDMLEEYDLSDGNVTERYSFKGRPWRHGNMKEYVDQSPITYADRIKTPTLILSCTGDYRVPITQSYALYHALTDNGIPTQFIAYPTVGHYPSDPVRSWDVTERYTAWLHKYLDPPASR